MKRRNVLVGLATFAAGPALAQSSPAPATDAPAAPVVPKPAPAEPGPAPAMKMAAPSGGDISEASTQWMKRTAAAGSTSLAVSRLALTKVKTAAVKQFVEFEIAEQETVADLLKSRMMPDLKPSGAVKPPTDAELTMTMDPAGKDLLLKLRTMKGGLDFDRDYVKAQTEGHRVLLGIQEDYLKVADDAEDTAIAKLARGMIKEHLALLADLGKKIG